MHNYPHIIKNPDIHNRFSCENKENCGGIQGNRKCVCKCHYSTPEKKGESWDEDIKRTLEEAYSRNDLGEKWAIAELSSLISSLLESERREMVRLIEDSKLERYGDEYGETYNQALDDVLALINSKK